MDRFLALIPNPQIPEDVLEDSTFLHSALATAQQVCELSGSKAFRRALLEGLLRTVETYLLTDVRLLEISKFWDTYLGRERDMIRARVQELLGTEPGTELIEYLRACVQARTWQNPTTGHIPQRTVLALFERVVEEHPRQELRCASCGYHFREGDMGGERLELIREFRLSLARSMDPRRKEDPLKPVVTSSARSLTELTIDHVVPVAGFGSSELNNLRFLCQFCNGGKLAYRRPLEPLSALVAGSLSGFPLSRPHSMLRQLTVASSIAALGECELCSSGVRERELTVQLHPADIAHRWWLVPWSLQAVCYECWSGLDPS